MLYYARVIPPESLTLKWLDVFFEPQRHKGSFSLCLCVFVVQKNLPFFNGLSWKRLHIDPNHGSQHDGYGIISHITHYISTRTIAGQESIND